MLWQRYFELKVYDARQDTITTLLIVESASITASSAQTMSGALIATSAIIWEVELATAVDRPVSPAPMVLAALLALSDGTCSLTTAKNVLHFQSTALTAMIGAA